MKRQAGNRKLKAVRRVLSPATKILQLIINQLQTKNAWLYKNMSPTYLFANAFKWFFGPP
jgi:hypothetical protein